MIQEPDTLPFFLELTQVFRLVQQSFDTVIGIGRVGVDQAASVGDRKEG